MNDAELPDEVWTTRPDVELTVIPQERRGRLKGEFTVTARNRSSQPVEAYICAGGNGLRCELGPSPIQLAPGGQGSLDLSVRSVDRPLFGEAITRPFEISCLATGGPSRSSTHSGRFVQAALVSPWLLLGLAGLGLLVGLVLAFALPDRTTVPSVTAAGSAIEAEFVLREAGLVLGSRFGRRPSDVATGTVLAQVPPAGTEVDEGSAVSIVVALPETETAAEESASSAQGDTATQRLIVLLPISFRGRCEAVAGAPALSVGSVYCVDSSGIELWLFEFASEPELQSSYAARVSASGAIRDVGECGIDARAEGAFEASDGRVRGRVLCTVDTQGTPVVIWTVDELLIRLEARWQRPASELADWWRDQGGALVFTTRTADPSQGAAPEGVAPAEGVAPQGSAPEDSSAPEGSTATQPVEPGPPVEPEPPPVDAPDAGSAPAEEPAPPEAVQPAGSEATTLQIAADPDGALAYDQTALTAPTGAITVEFTNEAALGHDFRIDEVGAGTSVFAEGSESLTVELEPGEYTFFCSVPGHRDAGMEGKLIVE